MSILAVTGPLVAAHGASPEPMEQVQGGLGGPENNVEPSEQSFARELSTSNGFQQVPRSRTASSVFGESGNVPSSNDQVVPV